MVPKTILSALFFILWWLCLLVVLPLGAKSQAEAGKVEKGTVPSAPAHMRLGRKMLQATGLSFIVWLIFAGLIMKYGFPH